MKRLDQNIDRVHIIGGVGQLTDIVQAMDTSLQNIADSTDRLTDFLLRFSDSNKGQQFEKIVNMTVRLRDELFEDAHELNDLQGQIVSYQNKVSRYEGLSESAPRPNPFLARKRPINVDTTQFQFNREEMLRLVAALTNYAEIVHQHLKRINDKKNTAGQIWRDTQYKDFAAFVEDVTRRVQDVLKDYGGFVQDIEERIKGLN